jgi:L-lactate dehydrogenase (cytochrome)
MSPMPFFCTDDARRLARRRLPRLVFDYVDGAAGDETAAALNRSALQSIRLQPRVLENVEARSLVKSLLGQDYGLPFGIAPMGMCNLVAPGADRLLTEEAVRRNVPHCLSCLASTTLEDIRARSGGHAWFQIYVGQSMALAKELIDRAEAAGYEVLVFTVDVPLVGRRLRDLKNGFQVPFRMGPRQFADFAVHPRWSLRTLLSGAPKPMNYETAENAVGFDRNASRANADWGFLAWLRNRWKGALIVKGVMSPADALRVKAAGVDAIWVSNHGGRQLGSAPAAIQALPQIRRTVGPDFPLLFDSGIRSGEDVVKALATGADFSMLGRPFLYAIGAAGAKGMTTLFDILEEDISTTLAQIGLTSVEQVDGNALASTPEPHGDDRDVPERLVELAHTAKG